MTGSKAKQERGRRAHESGLTGEAIARRLLETKGMDILAHRYRTPHGEIDLIAADGSTLVFIEVKSSKHHDAAAHAISPRQWARLEAAALHVLSVLGKEDAFAGFAARHPQPDMRFDVVLIDGQGMAEHLPNARRFDEW